MTEIYNKEEDQNPSKPEEMTKSSSDKVYTLEELSLLLNKVLEKSDEILDILHNQRPHPKRSSI